MDQGLEKMGWHSYVIAIYISIYDILKLLWDRNDAMFAFCMNAEGSGVIYRVKCIGNKVWIHWSVTGPSISRKILFDYNCSEAFGPLASFMSPMDISFVMRDLRGRLKRLRRIIRTYVSVRIYYLFEFTFPRSRHWPATTAATSLAVNIASMSMRLLRWDHLTRRFMIGIAFGSLLRGPLKFLQEWESYRGIRVRRRRQGTQVLVNNFIVEIEDAWWRGGSIRSACRGAW